MHLCNEMGRDIFTPHHFYRIVIALHRRTTQISQQITIIVAASD